METFNGELLFFLLSLLLSFFLVVEETGWRGGEITCLPDLYEPALLTRRSRRMWLLPLIFPVPCSERLSSEYSCFYLSS